MPSFYSKDIWQKDVCCAHTFHCLDCNSALWIWKFGKIGLVMDKWSKRSQSWGVWGVLWAPPPHSPSRGPKGQSTLQKFSRFQMLLDWLKICWNWVVCFIVKLEPVGSKSNLYPVPKCHQPKTCSKNIWAGQL